MTDRVRGSDPAGQVQQDHVPGGALNERADRRTVPRAHDQVALPVAALQPVQRLDGPLADHAHRRQSPAPLNAEQAPTAATTPRGAGTWTAVS